MLNFHRKEQWDLRCDPWLCVHSCSQNQSKRVFCLWENGLQIGDKLWIWGKRREQAKQELLTEMDRSAAHLRLS